MEHCFGTDFQIEYFPCIVGCKKKSLIGAGSKVSFAHINVIHWAYSLYQLLGLLLRQTQFSISNSKVRDKKVKMLRQLKKKKTSS